MAGKGGSWGRLGARDLKENTLEMGCWELGRCHCPPKQRQHGATNLDGGEWMENLQSGRNRYETLRSESSKQNLAESSVPGQQAGSRLAAGLVPEALLYFTHVENFSLPPK